MKAYLASGQYSGRNKLNGLAKDACHVTREVVAYFLKWAKENKVKVCGAPMEAEHQLVFMQRNKEIEWIYTIDSDVLPLGATNVIYEVRCKYSILHSSGPAEKTSQNRRRKLERSCR